MRYSYITPRVAPVVCDSVIAAREHVRSAIQSGSVRDIDRAYEELERADRIAKMRRTTARAMRAVQQALPSDPAWEKMIDAVQGFRK